ncbi:MAG: SCP2 sterol-binding domain-containing protein [Gammaproteobacteria bacterium]|nr:SCP2 sterol-binding domain-containing protein [Gammaproteobacteria bacterium]
MKKLLIPFFILFSINAFGNAQDIADIFNASSTPVELVESGWAGNDGGKGYKILQVVVKDTQQVAELHINNSGKVIAAFDSAQTAELNSEFDYKMIATLKDWTEMGTGESGPMYHMTFGGLSFEGPMGEAMGNMGPFSSFLINIGKNI